MTRTRFMGRCVACVLAPVLLFWACITSLLGDQLPWVMLEEILSDLWRTL